jgi:predicted AAA+ superfamily ATPase
MTQGELAGRPVNAVARLLRSDVEPAGTFPALSRADLLGRIRRGGLPTLAGLQAPLADHVRSQLAAEYVEAVIYHEAGKREDRAELIRTFRYLAAVTGRLLNVSTVASELGAKRETIKARMATLERSFLIHELPGHRPTEHRALTAHPKVHVVDTALAAWAARVDDTVDDQVYGALVETFVVNELAAQLSWLGESISLRHWRDTTRRLEVDALLLRDRGTSVAVEVKAAADVGSHDLVGLRACLGSVPGVERGIVFYAGSATLPFGDGIWAVPISALWFDIEAARTAQRPTTR